jgi:hypothetical protein
VGPVRHRRLINWLSMAVALQMSVALVAVAARAGRDIDPSGRTELSASGAQNGSILAGARIPKRRGGDAAEGPSATAPPVENTTTTAAPPPPPTAAPTTAPSTSAPPTTAATTAPTAPRATAPRATAPTAPRPDRTPRPTAAPAKAPAAAAGSPAAAGDKGQPGTLDDPANDTVADGSKAPLNDPRGDIVRAGAVYGPDGVTFAMQVQRPVDPRDDERWAADSTYAQWEVDTNGDSIPDFEVQYYFVDEDNLGGNVSKPGDSGEPVCDSNRGTYSADGYKLIIDPTCLGNPASFSYRATLFYDTNPADEDAAVVTDSAPNGGWSFPITRPS